MTLLHVIKYNPDALIEDAIKNNKSLRDLIPEEMFDNEEIFKDIQIPTREEFRALEPDVAKQKLRDILLEVLMKYEGDL